MITRSFDRIWMVRLHVDYTYEYIWTDTRACEYIRYRDQKPKAKALEFWLSVTIRLVSRYLKR